MKRKRYKEIWSATNIAGVMALTALSNAESIALLRKMGEHALLAEAREKAGCWLREYAGDERAVFCVVSSTSSFREVASFGGLRLSSGAHNIEVTMFKGPLLLRDAMKERADLLFDSLT